MDGDLVMGIFPAIAVFKQQINTIINIVLVLTRLREASLELAPRDIQVLAPL